MQKIDMKLSPLDDVLEKLSGGDDAAAEQVFVRYEPYLRKVIRRLLPDRLRGKFDTMDILQSAWRDVLQAFRKAGYKFTSANQLRAFLVTSTRNRFIDRFRQQDRLARLEEHLPTKSLEQLPAGAQASPSAEMEADDLWRRMLRLCPPEHQPILRLKRQGMALEDIAAQTGLHPGSVRRILRNLASQIAADPSTPLPAD
jgi:RNA polymerase sigma-70 factor (ECF subfamily)